ncbi:MAG: hypothetical protein ACRBBJ_11800 [Rhodomicrobiaceae bacterium]|jgi:hypothetical protein|nr:MAG: hypothetical protein DHS20C07_04390 [Methyloligella sp.]
MFRYLKFLNNIYLLAILGMNLVIYFAILNFKHLNSDLLLVIINNLFNFIPVGLGLACILIVNGIIDPQNKSRMVTWRWKYPLPGHYAFSIYSKNDPRIDEILLRKNLKNIPRNENKQNALWYSLYQSLSNEVAVQQAHKDYLLARDYTSLALLLILTLGVLSFWQFEKYFFILNYLFFLLFQYLLVRKVALNYGERFVTTVLAIKTSKYREELNE